MPVVFKGAALAQTHYTESWRRPRYDADVLITRDSRERVFAALEELGYTRRAFISGELVMYQAPFERVDHLGIEHALDIHWRIANPQVFSQVLTHGELVERSVTCRRPGSFDARALIGRCTAPGVSSIASLTIRTSRSRSGSRTSICWRRASTRSSGGPLWSGQRRDRCAPSAWRGLEAGARAVPDSSPCRRADGSGRATRDEPSAIFLREPTCVPSIV